MQGQDYSRPQAKLIIQDISRIEENCLFFWKSRRIVRRNERAEIHSQTWLPHRTNLTYVSGSKPFHCCRRRCFDRPSRNNLSSLNAIDMRMLLGIGVQVWGSTGSSCASRAFFQRHPPKEFREYLLLLFLTRTNEPDTRFLGFRD
jgi:hypothetical protein